MKKPPLSAGAKLGTELDKSQDNSTATSSPVQIIPSAPPGWQLLGGVVARVMLRLPPEADQ